MLKKALIFLMCVCMIFSCSACKSSDTKEIKTTEIIVENSATESVTDKTQATDSNTSTPSKTESSASKKPITSKPIDTKPTIKDQVNTDIEIKQPDAPKFDEIKHTFGNHKVISENEYYQLSTLNGNEKQLYLKIDQAVKNSQNIVNISSLNLKKESVIEVYTKFLIDYPQFFYISKNYFLIYNSTGSKVRAMVILYTDGEVTDDFDDNMNYISVANRDKINQKIAEVNTAINEIISAVPDDISDAQKEKILHDYVVDLVTYDDSYDNNSESPLLNTHVYDIYGALIEKSAVCEGYTKLFQYLCYNVGINSSQVFGETEDDLHVWNVVEIEGEWYHVDLTWNDEEDYISYSYFNLTTDEILKNHTIYKEEYEMPVCDSDINSFRNLFAINVTDTKKPPADYKTAIDNITATYSNEIYIYVENYRKDRYGNVNYNAYIPYIMSYFSKGSEISNYIVSLGLKLDSTIYANNEYIVLGLK